MASLQKKPTTKSETKKLMIMKRDQIIGIIRHALTFAGGFVVAKGYASEEVMAEAIGGTMSLVGIVWSIVAKAKK